MAGSAALLACCLATLASSFAPIVAPRAAATAIGAAPRWVDGPGDIEEAARVSKFTSNAVSVLYFSALASTHAVRRAVGGAAFHAREPRRAACD